MTIEWKPTVELDDLPVYLAIARALAKDISEGTLPAGTRLPTHRELAVSLGVARGTVTRAYLEAERRGLIHSAVGRGTFVRNPLDRRPSPFRIAERGDRGVVDLSANYPIPSLDPDLSPVLSDLKKTSWLSDLLRYHPSAGIDRHRQAGARWAHRIGIPTSPENVVVCAGAQHAILVALSTIASPGDLVACESLTYPGFKATAQLLGLRLLPLRLDEEGICPEDFAQACLNRPVRALYCMPTLQNPTSGVLSTPRRKEICEIAEKHSVVLIEDDVHRVHAPSPPLSFREISPEQTLSIVATSKAVAGGLRVAFLLGPDRLIDSLAHSVWATAGMTSPLPCEIMTRWIEDGTADRIVEEKTAEIQKRQKMAREIFRDAEIQSHPSSFFLWLKLPDPWSSAGFAMEARSRRVAVTPSNAFTLEAPHPAAVRVCLGAAEDRVLLARALETLRDLLAVRPDRGPTLF